MILKKSIQSAKGKICHVHVADNDRWFVGHGHYDSPETLGALKEIGYTGAVSVESFGFPDMISSARASYENMRHIMKSVIKEKAAVGTIKYGNSAAFSIGFQICDRIENAMDNY